MADFHAPATERRSGMEVLFFMLILMAGIGFGVRWWHADSRGESHTPLITTVTEVATSRASANSMNVLERPLFRLLAEVQSHVTYRWQGSWGWAIVLLTVAISCLMMPLRIRSMRSGLKMQRIQPQMAAIRGRYKGVALTDPKHGEMAAEIAQLQKEHGINVFGGCVPLLIQVPLLFAFFGMLGMLVFCMELDGYGYMISQRQTLFISFRYACLFLNCWCSGIRHRPVWMQSSES